MPTIKLIRKRFSPHAVAEFDVLVPGFRLHSQGG
jgi:hypothetical protein